MSVITVGKSPVLQFAPDHTHDVWEIVLNQQGSGYMTIGDRRYDYGPGTIICLPPQLPHTKYADGTFQDIYVQPSSFSLSAAGAKVLLFQDDAEKSCETLLLMMHQMYHKREENYKQVIEALYEAMEQLLIGWYRHTPQNQSVQQLKNHLVDRFTDPECDILSLCRDESYCPDHLRRLFKQETGMTPQQYVTNLRVNYAKKLMRNNGSLHYSIAQIGMLCGFYDTGYFARLFKKKTGMTPSEYLRKHTM